MTIETEIASLTQATTDLISAVNVKKAALDSAEANAVGALDDFETQYIGARASAPATDADGDPLITGALYYNTSNTTMFVYTGTAWDALVDNLVVDPNATITSNIATNGNDIKFGDNDKATFGASDDLQIYHDGSNSRIVDTGTGNLKIQATDIEISDVGGSKSFSGTSGAQATLYYNNSAKLATTSTGANVTGTLVADGLTVENATNSALTLKSTKDGVWTTDEVLGRIDFYGSDTSGSGATNKVSLSVESKDTFGAAFDLEIKTDSGLLGPTKTATFANNGDVSFYEDTGTTAKMVWDASAESLGIGTSTPSEALHISSGGLLIDSFIPDAPASGTSGFIVDYIPNQTRFWSRGDATTRGGYAFKILENDGGGQADAMTIDSAGKVGIGAENATNKLTVKDSNATTGTKISVDLGGTAVSADNNAAFSIYELGTEHGRFQRARDGSATVKVSALNSNKLSLETLGTGDIYFKTNNSERARIDSSGNLLVGKTAFNINTVGTQVWANGELGVTKAGGPPVYVNRTTSDGDIQVFMKDGSTVGSIGAIFGNLTVGTEDTGLRFTNGDASIRPWNLTANTVRDNAIDLGDPTARFKDLYLSGGVITSSDYRLKEDIQPMQSYADTVKQMNLVNFAWRETGEREDGFIAHELQALVPSAVRGDKDAVNEDGEAQHQGVDPLKLIPVLTKALQEALERIEILESK